MSDTSVEAIPVKILLSPDTTIRAIKPIHSQLLDALRGGVGVRVDCSQVMHCDLSVAQLLISASRAFGERQLDFALDAVPDCLGTVFSRAGLSLPCSAPFHS